MPIHTVKGGGVQWGGHGKVYRGPGAARMAAKQAAAAYANGYEGKMDGGAVGPIPMPRPRTGHKPY